MAAERGPAMATCTAPVNIAVIKYWGKRDTDLILPINSSLSVTLHQDQLKTTTTAAASRDFTEDRLWLNGKEADVGHPRVQACLREVRRLARKRRGGGEDAAALSLSYKIHIASENNFPTAAGLASSAAGYACLVSALARLYGLEEELSEVARRGSGSACRSMFGGFVQWQRGERPDGTDSLALQVAPETHWPELRVLVLVVSGEKKPVGSTVGMQTSVETSPLLKHRAESVVPERLAQMMRHIQERDFEGFGQLAMRDSNQFHATCLDTFPPIFYLTDLSRQIIALAHRYNAHHGHTKVAYTFDAGPNAVIFALADTVAEFVEVVRRSFPPAATAFDAGPNAVIFALADTVAEFVEVVRRSFPPAANGDQFVRGLPVGSAALAGGALQAVGFPGVPDPCPAPQPGPGPQLVDDPSQHLLGADGLPRSRA
ncbi:PREDICTED: LOW QUALITY PROTEIN: diphosphomevalonate decarboxylase [Ficedula albicollis]|uniref:LOW QUALITY PROTEIN: diphosphomevalonate decarboxylase n=1 Tax=Ficedula albicollis TaxID=59894 RepID=UPI0007AD78F8|nr:PREDICTED: LOW QUALITY PROTEIN: diphosphomevalonate decarboxylase [Ficedula albicollis]